MLAGFAFTACNDVETEISGLESRVEALENSVKDLQAQITAGAVITDVTNTAGGVKVTLSNGKSFELTNGTNGTNGANGANGKDGSVVTVGGNGNWFIDGVDTGLAVEGKNGVDGCYYVPNAETGCFDKVLADGTVEATEISWVNAGGVTAVWENDVLKVYGVEGVAEGECVEIYLSSALKSLAYLPETLLDSRGVIDFTNLYVKDAAGKENAVFVTSAPAVAKYRVNPHNADVTNVEWSVLTRGVQTRAAAVPTIKVDGVTAGSKGKQGYYDFALVAEGTLPAQCTAAEVAGTEQVLASLVATTPEGEVIVSDEAYAQQVTNDDYKIVNKTAYYKTSGKSLIVYNHDTVEDLGGYADFELVYNSEINIVDSLETYAADIAKALPEINVVPTYVVTLPETYLGADKTTNQQKFVNLAEGVLTVNSEFLANSGRAAIGRTPIVKVYSVVNDITVDSTYLKIEIVDVPAPVVPDKDAKTFITKSGEYEYAHIGYEVKDGKFTPKHTDGEYETIAITWEEANADILDVLGLSYEQFLAKYDVHSFRTLPATLPAGINVVADGMEDKTATNFMYMTVDCAVKEDTTGTVKVIIPAVDPKVDAPVAVEFTYTVKHNHEWPEFNPDYLLADETVNTVQVKGKKIDGTWSMTSFIAEHFKDYEYSEMEEHHNPIDFNFPVYDKDGKEIGVSKTTEGAEIGMVNGELAIYLTEPLEVKSQDYTVKMTETLCNGNECVQYYEVRFVSPFEVTLSPVTLKTYIANPDAVNLNSALVVKDTDGNVIAKADDNNELVLTDVAKSTYGLTTVPTVEYELVYAETGNDTEPSFGGNLNIAAPYVIWDNDGTDLQNNKVAAYTATVTFETICVLAEESTVTVLSTANSKGNGEATELPTPNFAQWVFQSGILAGEGLDLVFDLGVTNPTTAAVAISADDAYGADAGDMAGKWHVINGMEYADYAVTPLTKTSGIITVEAMVFDFMTWERVAKTLVIEYFDLTATTCKFVSEDLSFGDTWSQDGLNTLIPVSATKATETVTVIPDPYSIGM